MDPRELVYVLAGVLRVGDAVAELEVERLEQLVAEEVSLDHPEVADWRRAYGELDAGEWTRQRAGQLML